MTIHVDPKFHRQVELEVEMSGLGVATYRSRVRKDIEAERGYETKTGRHILEAVVEPFGDGIKAFVEDVYSGRPGPKAVAAKLIKDIDPYVVAFLAARSILGRLMMRSIPPLVGLAAATSKQIELEARFTTFANSNKALFAVISKSLAEGGANERHKATVLTYAMGKGPLRDHVRWCEDTRQKRWPGLCPDYHAGNYMRRPATGEIVLTDPWA